MGLSVVCTDAPMIPCSDASYLDDAVFFVDACDSFALINKMVAVAGIVIDVTQAHGLRVNLKKGKTEAVLSFSGKGSREARMKVLCAGALAVRTSSRGVVDLCVVRYYKHMGALSSPECNVAPEVRARVRLARAAFVEFRSGVFANRGLNVNTRMEFLHAFVDSRLFYGASTWCKLSSRSVACIESLRVQVCRTIHRMHNAGLSAEDRTSDTQVIQKAKLTAATVVIRCERLRYFRRNLITAPPARRSYNCCFYPWSVVASDHH